MNIKIYLQHLFVLSCKQRHGAKDQLKKFQVKVGELHVGAHLRQPFQKILHQDGGKQGRSRQIGQEGVSHDLKCPTTTKSKIHKT